MSITLIESGPPVPSVGSPVVWTATADGHGATPVYQFSVRPNGGTSQVVRDFSASNSFTWDPLQEGSYDIQVTVKDGFGATTGESAIASYVATSRVVGSDATISAMSNPLVALYSAPPSSGHSMYVEFSPMSSNPSWLATSPLPIVPGKSTNFLVAGLLPNTTYLMRHVQDDGTTSAPLTFRTGALPTNVTLPTFDVEQAPTPAADLSQNLVFHVGIANQANTIGTVATDRAGNIVWYYDSVANEFPGYAPSLVPGGTVLLVGVASRNGGSDVSVREVNLAGDTLRETNIYAVNPQLAALGLDSITDFNHEAVRLPNGDTAVLARTPRIVNLNGTPTQYDGEMVIVLDQNFQVAWVWDPFAHLDTNRLPTLGEDPTDWMHSNAIAWSPADENLIVSMRSQDWVIKIDYANGAGDGHVIWRLGQGGDFAINSSDPSPWFSHQHDARYINDTTLVLFDDGNTRRSTDPTANSRGQVLVLDERTMQATLTINVDLGEYAYALGSAQVLPNGNLDFTSGFTQKTIEVLPDGTQTYVIQMNLPGIEYRSYIYKTLYRYSVDYRSSVAPAPTSDLSVFRPSTGAWYDATIGGTIVANGLQWGLPGDLPVPGDFDGDGKSDLAVFRPSNGNWYILTTNGQVILYGQQWGLKGDIPSTGDFDGDGKSDLAVFRPSNNNWYIRTVDGRVIMYGQQWGLKGDKPEVGDFDGDGKTDLAVFRPSNNKWYIRTVDGRVIAYGAKLGQKGDVPIPGDFDGDGKSDLAVFRPSNNKWYIKSVGGPVIANGQRWGLKGDIPSTGDFDGDGKSDLAVFRPSNGKWYIAAVGGPVITYGQQWGLTGDIPTTATDTQKADLAAGTTPTTSRASTKASVASSQVSIPLLTTTTPTPSSSALKKKRNNPKVIS